MKSIDYQKRPIVSVVMPVYNTREEYLCEAIESILDQTFTDFEFIIVDDGSDERTKRIIDSYCDDRIIVVTNIENIGITKSLNKGISIAKGKYIARMDSDDISSFDRFEKQVAYLESHPNINILGTYVYDGDQIRYEFSDISQKERRTLFILENVGPIHPSVMIRKIFFDNNRIRYNEDFRFAQDYELWIRCNELTDICFYPEPLLRRRKHQDRTGNRNRSEQYYLAVLNKARIIAPLVADCYDQNDIIRILSGVSDGGIKYVELTSFLKLLYQKNKKRNLYEKKTLRYVVSAYKVLYVRNKYNGIIRRIYQIPLVLFGDLQIYKIYRMRRLKRHRNV